MNLMNLDLASLALFFSSLARARSSFTVACTTAFYINPKRGDGVGVGDGDGIRDGKMGLEMGTEKGTGMVTTTLPQLYASLVWQLQRRLWLDPWPFWQRFVSIGRG